MEDLTLERMNPFGLLVEARRPESDLRAVSTSVLKQWVDDERVVILRGFAPLHEQAFPDFCLGMGELLEWDFGVVNRLSVQPQAQNYLYTNRDVPFHWDGAFAGRVPHYIIFHCDDAPRIGAGGETLFCDAIRLLARVPSDQLEVWRRIDITYTTEKLVHYGGTFSAPLISRHPTNGEYVLRFAEPVADLNPVQLEIHGIPAEKQNAFLADMHERLHEDAVCYRHEWRTGDVLIADNFVLLHGRRGFDEPGRRKIRRVNVL